MFVLDTNALIYLFKNQGHVAAHFLATPPSDIALPSIVLFELETGIAKSKAPKKRRDQLDTLLKLVTVLPFGVGEARDAASIRAHLERRGTPIGPMDTLIAATARAHGATLVTRNLQEFSRVPNLSLKNWYDMPWTGA